MTARFGDMLQDRRRQLGLSIQQVANTIKMRPQIIEFFETCNYEAMPPRGYAQGMISSYARYLGLNPREVVDAYFDGLYAYERTSGQPGSGRELPPALSPSSRSANATGRFMMVDSRDAGSRFAQRPPQAGYVPESRSQHEMMGVTQMRSGRPPHPGHRDPAQTGRMPAQGGRDGRRAPVGTARYRGAERPPQRGQGGGLPPRGGRPGDRAYRGGGMPPRRGNTGGFDLSTLLSDPRIALGLLAAVGVLLLLVIVLAFRGCAGGEKPLAGSADEKPVTSQPASGDDDAKDDGDEPAATDDDKTDADGDDKEPALPTEYKVKVSYTGTGTAWLEIKVNGEYDSEVSTVTEGFTKEYTVEDSIEIMTDSPSDIEVTRDGERVKWDSKSSGVGRVSITVPKPVKDEDDKAGGPGTDGASADAVGAVDGTDGGTDGPADSGGDGADTDSAT